MLSSEPVPCSASRTPDNAATTIAGVELLRRIYKNQFSLGCLRLKEKAASEIWNVVLAA